MRLHQPGIHFIQYPQKTNRHLNLYLFHRYGPLTGRLSPTPIRGHHMVLEPIANILVDLLHQLNTFFMGFVGDSYRHQPLDDGTEQVQ